MSDSKDQLEGYEMIWALNAPDRPVHFAVKWHLPTECFVIEASLIDDDYPLDFGMSPEAMRALCDALAAKLAEIASDAELPPVREDKSLHA
jgi:hypothetical protein